jgi:hypothetical protein
LSQSNLELAIEAGNIKKRFGIALTNYVLATARINKCKEVFKSSEEKMKKSKRLENFGKKS